MPMEKWSFLEGKGGQILLNDAKGLSNVIINVTVKFNGEKVRTNFVKFQEQKANLNGWGMNEKWKK